MHRVRDGGVGDGRGCSRQEHRVFVDLHILSIVEGFNMGEWRDVEGER